MIRNELKTSLETREARYHEFYKIGSRLDVEFRFTRQMVMTARKWTSYIDETIRQATGHPRAHWQTLFALAFSEGPVPTLVLSERLGVRWPTLIRTLNKLEKLGMVVRYQNEDDRRSRLVGITEKGMELVVAVKQILDPTRNDLLRPLNVREMRETEETLKKFQLLLARITGD